MGPGSVAVRAALAAVAQSAQRGAHPTGDHGTAQHRRKSWITARCRRLRGGAAQLV